MIAGLRRVGALPEDNGQWVMVVERSRKTGVPHDAKAQALQVTTICLSGCPAVSFHDTE